MDTKLILGFIAITITTLGLYLDGSQENILSYNNDDYGYLNSSFIFIIILNFKI